MTKITADRVLETSTTTGTGAITVAGAVAGFQAFSDTSIASPSDTCDVVVFAVNGSGVPSGQWQSFLGTYTSANTLARTTPLDGSDGPGVDVDFAAGTKYVMLIERASGGGGGGGSYRGVQMRTGAITLDPGDNLVNLQAGTETVLIDTDSALSGGYITVPAGVTAARIEATITIAYDPGDPVTFVILHADLVSTGGTAFGGQGVTLPLDGGSCHFIGAVTEGDQIALGANIGVGTGADVHINVSVDFF